MFPWLVDVAVVKNIAVRLARQNPSAELSSCQEFWGVVLSH